MLEFATDSSTLLIPQARHASYVATGHLLYVAEDGGLFAVPFDLGRHRVTGSAVRVLDRVAANNALPGYSVSRDGVLVHHEGASSLVGGIGETLLLMMDFAGRTDTLRLPPGRRIRPRFAPNGRALVLEYLDPSRNGSSDIYTFDLVTGTSTQLTFDKAKDHDEPIWSPDGKRILFTSDSVAEDLFTKPADNSGAEELVLTLPGDQNASAWLDDGTIVFTSGGAGNNDLFTYSPTDKGTARPYLEAPWNESALAVSPDRKLAAFVSNETGASEIWLRSWPVAEGKWRVSSGAFSAAAGGPRWSRDGRHVYFWRAGTPIDTLFRVRVDRTPGIVVRSAERVLTLNVADLESWDLHPDGTRFVVAAVPGAPSAASVGTASESRYLVVLNWFTELREMMARGSR